MKVGFASADWSSSVKDENGHPVWGGSGWARLGQYVDRMSMEVVYGTLISNRESIFGVRDWNGGDHFDCDVVVMQRYMFESIGKILKAKATGQVVINDVDDWYWGLRPSNSAWYSSHPKVNPEENVNHYSTILAHSPAVMVSTPFLYQKLSPKIRSGNVTIVGNYVDVDRFPKRVHEDGPIVVGWAGSTMHRSGDLETLAGVLAPLERDGVKFHHSGHLDGCPEFAEATRVSEATTSPLVAPALYPNSFTFDVGIVPLSDVPFNHAKSYIKGLEYAAAGVPFVASAVGEYVRLHNEYGVGRIAKSAKDWHRHIRQLSDAEVRKAEAERNLAIVKEHFSIGQGAANLDLLLRKYASSL